MSQTNSTPTTTQNPLAMEEIYNLFMREIEPDLTTDMLPFLDEMYEGETEEERKMRGESYAEAFEEFAVRFDKAMAIWKEQILKLKEWAFGIAREKSGKEDIAKLSEIEQSFGISQS